MNSDVGSSSSGPLLAAVKGIVIGLALGGAIVAFAWSFLL